MVNYCMLTSMEAHAVPLTPAMVEYLRRNEIIEPNTNEEDIEGFLTRQIPAKSAYEFYALLRRESESPKVGKKKRAVRNAGGKAKRA